MADSSIWTNVSWPFNTMLWKFNGVSFKFLSGLDHFESQSIAYLSDIYVTVNVQREVFLRI